MFDSNSAIHKKYIKHLCFSGILDLLDKHLIPDDVPHHKVFLNFINLMKTYTEMYLTDKAEGKNDLINAINAIEQVFIIEVMNLRKNNEDAVLSAKLKVMVSVEYLFQLENQIVFEFLIQYFKPE